MHLRLVGFVAALLVVARPASAGPEASALERFEKNVRPLLAAKCWQCHGPEKRKGGLRLDSAEGLAAGGDSGPAVVAGRPQDSRLIQAVRYGDDLKLPPKGKLSDLEVSELTEWVRQGAVWPVGPVSQTVPFAGESATSRAPGNAPPFWAFQPPRDPHPPAVRDSGWPRSALDTFVLAGLERKGLAPAPQAQKRALIRRATFDLTGVPPTTGEVESFLADETPEAFARVVDRLLASPRYGERWGRHWLDLARYADSNGMDENVAYANAFRYRDYVIAAFNADKPYDRFLREQLAGDLSEGEAGYERLTATGFLVIGPKMLAEDDPVKMEMDIIDEQVDTVGRVVMGLTLGCARCHDHKFDPITTADYYGLAGIFKSTKSMQNHKVVALWNELPLATASERAAADAHKAEVARRTAAIQAVVDRARGELTKESRARVADYLVAAWPLERFERLRKTVPTPDGSEPGALIREAEAFDRGNVIRDSTAYGQGIGVILNRGELPNWVEYDVDVPAGTYQVALRYAAAEARPVRLSINGVLAHARAAASATGSWLPDGQRWASEGIVPLGAGRATIRLECDGPFPHFDKLAFVPRPLPEGLEAADLKTADERAREHGLNPRLLERWKDFIARSQADSGSIFHAARDRHAIEPAVRAALEREPVPTSSEALASRYQELFDEAGKADADRRAKEPVLAAFGRVLDDPSGPFALPMDAEALFPDETARELKRLRVELVELEKKAPVIRQAMGVSEQSATNLRIHIRGSHLTLGAEVPRRFPEILAGTRQEPIGAKQSGRKELAEWLTRADHPLTARVMVNRIWLGHFGAGLVGSADNFGRLGERPTHPELLDWLARRFVESGWSVKAMHRLIMLSSTYEMSTQYDAKAALADPDNRLHWRMSRRRLEAEAVRDALLAVSGELDATMGGSLLKTANHAYVNSTGPRGEVLYDANRRSVYLPVIRSGLYDVFQAFDFADPSSSTGQRVPTTVAPQALFMLNDRLVLRCAEAMARRLLNDAALDDAGRVREAYLRAYGRPPEDQERVRALAYLRRFDDALATEAVAPQSRTARAWQELCHAILAASEFLYLD
ncbi:MAG: DUF1553 domain-containing protein [Isosphaeraceae bacterium]|nr:DUF1553 domain-containing protein [Isosphaeraceae bacterium]